VSKTAKHKTNYIDFSTPVVMGILNITTDSFFDGGKFLTKENIIKQAQKIEEEGAKIIDIGASSSRPGSTPVSEEIELERLIPAIKLIQKNTKNLKISIDTFRAKVAEECIKNGAHIINDISAGEKDLKMFETIINLDVPYIMMHMQGNSNSMQVNPTYDDVTSDIISFFEQKVKQLNAKGFKKIIIDPGFGFGKTIEHNYEILKNLKKFKKLNFPLLAGLSRKSMIYNLLDTSAEDALNGTTVANTISLLNGANILRVHDVKQALECIRIYAMIRKMD
jgi:dihydropteroate synthase